MDDLEEPPDDDSFDADLEEFLEEDEFLSSVEEAVHLLREMEPSTFGDSDFSKRFMDWLLEGNSEEFYNDVSSFIHETYGAVVESFGSKSLAQWNAFCRKKSFV